MDEPESNPWHPLVIMQLRVCRSMAGVTYVVWCSIAIFADVEPVVLPLCLLYDAVNILYLRRRRGRSIRWVGQRDLLPR